MSLCLSVCMYVWLSAYISQTQVILVNDFLNSLIFSLWVMIFYPTVNQQLTKNQANANVCRVWSDKIVIGVRTIGSSSWTRPGPTCRSGSAPSTTRRVASRARRVWWTSWKRWMVSSRIWPPSWRSLRLDNWVFFMWLIILTNRFSNSFLFAL